MTRRAWFATVFGVTATASTVTADASYVLASGQLNASDHELAAGYAAIGQGGGIMVRPGTPFHDRLSQLARDKPLVSLIVRIDA